MKKAILALAAVVLAGSASAQILVTDIDHKIDHPHTVGIDKKVAIDKKVVAADIDHKRVAGSALAAARPVPPRCNNFRICPPASQRADIDHKRVADIDKKIDHHVTDIDHKRVADIDHKKIVSDAA